MRSRAQSRISTNIHSTRYCTYYTVDYIDGDIHPLVLDHRISCYHFIVLNKFNFPDT